MKISIHSYSIYSCTQFDDNRCNHLTSSRNSTFSPDSRKIRQNVRKWAFSVKMNICMEFTKFLYHNFWNISVKTTSLEKSFTIKLISRNNSQVIQKFVNSTLCSSNFEYNLNFLFSANFTKKINEISTAKLPWNQCI